MTYPGLIERIKAAAIDGLVIVLMLIGFSKLFGLFDHVPDLVRGATIVFIFLIYEPLFISLFGATIGHSSTGLIVRSAKDPSKKISFPLAIIRFALKIAIGWLSLLTVSFNETKSAIHDMIAGSVVHYAENEK